MEMATFTACDGSTLSTFGKKAWRPLQSCLIMQLATLLITRPFSKIAIEFFLPERDGTYRKSYNGGKK